MATELESIWQSAFPDTSRPVLYASQELNEDGFLPLNEASRFSVNITGLNRHQLYATSSNNQHAMKAAQDEYLELQRRINWIKDKDEPKNPQQLQPPDVFEEQKEAILYSYKYDPNKPALLQSGIPGLRTADEVTASEKHDVRLNQEPFEQGGFVPTERQFKAMRAKARNPKNIDGWQPVYKNGKALIPRQQTHRDEYSIKYNTNNNKTASDILDALRPRSAAGSDASANTPSKAVDKRLTRTRFDGKKVPATRDVSEAPSLSSASGRKRESTPLVNGREETPNAKRRRLNDPNRPKQPNQYTKAREAREAKEAQEAKEAAEGRTSTVNTPVPERVPATKPSPKSFPVPLNVDWKQFSDKELQDRKWTDEELVAAVTQHHSWLHDDEKKAETWKWKIINGTNPVRSFSMFRKWAYWKVTDQDKRPRNKKNLMEGGVSGPPEQTVSPMPSPKPRQPAKIKFTSKAESSRTTPATTPVRELANGIGSQEMKRTNGSRSGLGRKANMGNKSYKTYEDSATDDEIQVMTEKEQRARAGQNRGPRLMDVNIDDSPQQRPTLTREESDSTIVINGTTPTRRSLRKSRGASG
ncbi:hypothetical protein LTR84_005391 [Exophiala bonariae]|uniref:Uncharacterized protein n=1 Tax=Exophiala bonariae TaxID=1690606 RepID=A0AAV9N7T8_9EURO|nr:hypothetical protein LTR84_005391 [Exophiala bonariae]